MAAQCCQGCRLPPPPPLLLLLLLLLLLSAAHSRGSSDTATSRTLLHSLLRTQPASGQRSHGSWRATKTRYRQSYVGGQLLPTCSPRQVCSTVYPRLQLSTAQCVCPRRSPSPCSRSLLSTDGHSVSLITDPEKGALTTVKTCERSRAIPDCTGDDWALLAVQNARTGRSNFLVVCRCPADALLEGPLQHRQPYHAHVPTIRVYGMMCRRRHSHHSRHRRSHRPGRYRVPREAAAVSRLLRLAGALQPSPDSETRPAQP